LVFKFYFDIASHIKLTINYLAPERSKEDVNAEIESNPIGTGVKRLKAVIH